jgi:hypothetical protein
LFIIITEAAAAGGGGRDFELRRGGDEWAPDVILELGMKRAKFELRICNKFSDSTARN